MVKNNQKKTSVLLVSAGLLMSSVALASDDYSVNFSGYVRAQASMFLEDQEETTGDDKWDLGMARTSLQLVSASASASPRLRA